VMSAAMSMGITVKDGMNYQSDFSPQQDKGV